MKISTLQDCKFDFPTLVNATHCPGCTGSQLTDFFVFEDLPVHVGIFYDRREQALHSPTGSVTLSYCHTCGMVHNRQFDADLIAYAPGYEVALHHSAVFRSFTEGVTRRLIDQYGVQNKQVLELGCGDGYFLRMLCELGTNDGVGIDPTVPREGTEQVGEGRVRFIRDYFTEKYSDLQPEFICCLSVFEHIPDPAALLQSLRRMVGDRQIPIYFEVFNAFRAFEQKETWSIHYEQCNYFSQEALRRLFVRCGFEVLQASTCYEGGQYLFVDALPGCHQETIDESCRDALEEMPDELKNFGETHQKQLTEWSARLTRYQAEGKRVVVWGTGGKGISFLNALKHHDLIQYVVEINPDKQGKYVPGSGQLIVHPSFLAEYQPDVAIITNPLYESEMKQQARELGVHCEFLIA